MELTINYQNNKISFVTSEKTAQLVTISYILEPYSTFEIRKNKVNEGIEIQLTYKFEVIPDELLKLKSFRDCFKDYEKISFVNIAHLA